MTKQNAINTANRLADHNKREYYVVFDPASADDDNPKNAYFPCSPLELDGFYFGISRACVEYSTEERIK